jgi:hypothetical protein
MGLGKGGGKVFKGGEYVQIEIPLEIIEHLFSALHVIRPNYVTKMEKKALDLFKDHIYYTLEVYMETEEEAEERKLKFKQLFEEMRQKKEYEQEKETAY